MGNEEANSVAEVAVPEVETSTPAESNLPIEEPKGLSLRDALEVAKIAVDDKYENARKEAAVQPNQDGASKTAAQTNAPRDSQAPVSSEEAKYEPPAEYTTEEKHYFSQLSRKGQEAQLRLDKSRKSKLDELRSASREYEYVKRLAQSVDPYIKARGLKESPEVALSKALEMWREFEDGDPKQKAAEYLRAKGIEPPRELLEQSPVNQYQQEIAPLQSELNLIKQRLAEEDRARAEASLSQAWSTFEQEKNAAGAPKFPDIATNSESGLRLASNIGSLVSGTTDLSRQFIANVQARIPDATYIDVMAEAYKYLGGRVDESSAPKSQTSQQDHIKQSNRAAASVPGRSAGINGSGGIKKYKSIREAAEAALIQLNLR